jgi:hypothetical protein
MSYLREKYVCMYIEHNFLTACNKMSYYMQWVGAQYHDSPQKVSFSHRN